MKHIELNDIEISGEKYPLYCDMNVLEEIQSSGMSVNEFERKILGLEVIRDEAGAPKYNDKGAILNKQKEPDIKTVMNALMLMINEGYKVQEFQSGSKAKSVTVNELNMINDVPYVVLAIKLHDEFNRCFDSKKNLNQQKETQKKTRATN